MNEEQYLKNLLEKVSATKDAEQLFDLVKDCGYGEGHYYGYEGCEEGLYLPYLNCEIPLDNYDLFECLKIIGKAPEIPAILQNEDGNLIVDKNYIDKLYYVRVEAYEDGEIEDNVDEVICEFWASVGDAYRWSDVEWRVDALCMWEHKYEIMAAIEIKIGEGD